MTQNFIPAGNLGQLAQRSSAALLAVGDLMQTITEDLPDTKRQALLDLMAGGGRVGLELTVDKDGATRIALVAIEREGIRREVATVKTVATPGADTSH
jgi:hypothetical protein